MMYTLLQKLTPRYIEEGDCLIWQGGCNGGHPSMRHEGEKKLVRRVLWELANGPIPAGKIMTTTCQDVRCINPEHAMLTTMSKLTTELGPAVMGGLKRSANVSRAKRLQPVAKLTPQIVRDIRASTETGAQWSRRLSIPESLVSKVRLHRVWEDYSSPFAGLGARA
jgi:hypothetical protein